MCSHNVKTKSKERHTSKQHNILQKTRWIIIFHEKKNCEHFLKQLMAFVIQSCMPKKNYCPYNCIITITIMECYKHLGSNKVTKQYGILECQA